MLIDFFLGVAVFVMVKMRKVNVRGADGKAKGKGQKAKGKRQ